MVSEKLFRVKKLSLNLDFEMPKLSASRNYPTFKQLVVCGTEKIASFINKQNVISQESFINTFEKPKNVAE
jgi:hypothetical protein